MIELEQGLASGFYFKTRSYTYFVTAKHVLFTDKLELKSKKATLRSYRPDLKMKAPIMNELDLSSLLKKDLIMRHKTHDVAVIKLCKSVGEKILCSDDIKFSAPKEGLAPIAVDHTAIRLYKDVQLANRVYMLGYPISLSMTHPLIRLDVLSQLDYRKPLLRSGIVAGKNSKLKTIIVDCPSYKGNSGGPVMEIVQTETSRYALIIGVVSRFLPYIETWKSDRHNYVHPEIRNSGYSILMPMDVVLELIEMYE